MHCVKPRLMGRSGPERTTLKRLALWGCCWFVALPQLGLRTGHARQIQLDVAFAHPTMFIGEGDKGENHLRIALTGFELPNQKERMPVNVAIVIDKSGSMQGEKIEQARRAAIQAIDRLHDSDIVSVVVYDSSVQVLVPATKASDRQHLKQLIRSIQAGGNTALFAGVSKGATEIRKFLDDKRVNRVVLLSDGLANVGPDSPSELEELGESLIKEGISVSTLGLGLGYNEDLMSRLALASSGNHVFIEDAEDLVQVFQNEFDDVLSVVAQKIRIKVDLAEGIRPVKLLNYPANVTGQHVTIDVGQLYSKQERYFVLEVEVPYGSSGTSLSAATVNVDYMNLFTETVDKLSSSVAVKFTNSKELAEAAVNPDIMAACVIQIANERNREATRLRDAGQIDEARELLRSNGDYLERANSKLQLPGIQSRAALNYSQAEGIAAPDWTESRKRMIEQQFGDTVQQTYGGQGKKIDK